MKQMMQNISHYGDMIAIPFFALLAIYFYMIDEKTPIEYILMVFGISGFFLDIFYTYLFLTHNK
jgi:hypothetical protein